MESTTLNSKRENLELKLCKAAQRGSLKAVLNLLAKGVDGSCYNNQPMRWCVFFDHAELMRTLLTHGVSIRENLPEFLVLARMYKSKEVLPILEILEKKRAKKVALI